MSAVDSPAAMTAFIKLASNTSFHTITPSVPVAFMSRVFVCPGSPGVFEQAAFNIGCFVDRTTGHTQKSHLHFKVRVRVVGRNM